MEILGISPSRNSSQSLISSVSLGPSGRLHFYIPGLQNWNEFYADNRLRWLHRSLSCTCSVSWRLRRKFLGRLQNVWRFPGEPNDVYAKIRWTFHRETDAINSRLALSDCQQQLAAAAVSPQKFSYNAIWLKMPPHFEQGTFDRDSASLWWRILITISCYSNKEMNCTIWMLIINFSMKNSMENYLRRDQNSAGHEKNLRDSL
jgi:hypothetical protein